MFTDWVFKLLPFQCAVLDAQHSLWAIKQIKWALLCNLKLFLYRPGAPRHYPSCFIHLLDVGVESLRKFVPLPDPSASRGFDRGRIPERSSVEEETKSKEDLILSTVSLVLLFQNVSTTFNHTYLGLLTIAEVLWMCRPREFHLENRFQGWKFSGCAAE